MDTRNFQESVLKELVIYFEPITNLDPANPDDIFAFFNYCGWDLNTILGANGTTFITKVSAAITAVEDLVAYIQNPPQSFEDFVRCLEKAATIVAAIKALTAVTAVNAPPGWTTDLPVDVLEKLAIIYLLNRSQGTLATYFVIAFIDVIRQDAWADVAVNDYIVVRKNRLPRLNTAGIGHFLSDPVGTLKTLYLSNFQTVESTSATGKKLFEAIQKILRIPNLDVIVGRGVNPPPLPPPSDPEYPDEVRMNGMMTLAYNIATENIDSTITAMLGLLSQPEGGPGIFCVPEGTLNFTEAFGDWTLTVSADTELPGFQITGSGLTIYNNPTRKSFKLKASFGKADREDGVAFLIGSVTGTHLRIGTAQLTGMLDVLDNKWLADVSVNVRDAAFVIKGGDGDSFLSKLLPANGITINFELLVGYNNQRGLYFGGGAGLEVEIPVHKKLLGIEFDSVTLSIYVKPDGTIPITGAVSVNADIGPLHMGVKNIGVKANVAFPSNGGNLGPIDLTLGFKKPSGVAIGIDAKPVSGGGFLNYDEATSTYTGGLELNFSKIAFKAIGIISTKLPGGAQGYSLLIIITAEFTPIQLGMGFTLNGLGGILGLNRTMNPDFLRNGIRNKTLDSILFPQDIVKNANTIISNLSQAFPVKEGQFLIGPMAKIGWGTPTLITIDLGIIIELPEPVRLAILGVLRALLPDPDKAIIKLQINFIGIIDFTNKYLSFDASLFESSILAFVLEGDMALRLYWGDKPNFLMSVGGFHPKYTPPPLNLPQMRRLSISLTNSDRLVIRVETYFAVTSNSVQFGAKVYARAKAWKIEAVGALWFDILFQFSPFYFIADMGVMFAIKMGSKEILAIFINLSLEGPNPWHAQGKGSFKILFVKVSVSFDKTFGSARTEVVESVTTYDKIAQAVNLKDNWQAVLPDRSSQLVAYREVAIPDTVLQADPGGSLVFTQKVLPFNMDLQKLGTAAIRDNRRYELTPAQIVSGNPALSAVQVKDFFARNEFFYMKDEEKLSKDAYEQFDSGIRIGIGEQLVSGYFVHRECDYEEIFIDTGFREKKIPKRQLSLAEFNSHLFGGYISSSSLSRFGTVTTPDGPARTQVLEADYVLATRNNFTRDTNYPPFGSYTEAETYLRNMQQTNPQAAALLLVADVFELDI